jgi:hypothetical protein
MDYKIYNIKRSCACWAYGKSWNKKNGDGDIGI